MNRKLVAFVPNMCDVEGHWHFYHTHFHRIAKELQIPYELHYPAQAEKFFAPVEWKRSLRIKTSFLTFDFMKIFLFRKGARLFFIESFNDSHLKALSLAVRLFARKNDRIWFLIRDVWTGCGVGPITGPQYLKRLKTCKGFTLLTDSAKFLPVLEETFHCKAHLFPVLLLEEERKMEKTSQQRLVCLFHGKPRKSKGVEHIHSLLESQDPSTRRFEMAFSFAFPATERKVDNALHVRCFEEALPREDYLKELQESSIVLLPYLPENYRFRTSGIFVEAIFWGKLVVVHEETWLAYELRKYGLEKLIVDWKNPYFFSHLLTLYEDEEIAKKLKNMQHSYRKLHSKEEWKKSVKTLYTATA